jgi:hypothetical protein
MFCPQCGQRQISNEARFCSSCGFQMNVVSELLTSGGQMPWRPPPQQAASAVLSPRQRGVRQGAMLMLSTMLVVPVIAIVGVALLELPAEFAGLAAVICFLGGLLRILYAIFLEDNGPRQITSAATQAPYVPPASIPNYLGAPSRGSTLPPAQGTPVHTPRPLDTGQLASPHSVTDHTTRLLGKQPDDQPKQ